MLSWGYKSIYGGLFLNPNQSSGPRVTKKREVTEQVVGHLIGPSVGVITSRPRVPFFVRLRSPRERRGSRLGPFQLLEPGYRVHSRESLGGIIDALAVCRLACAIEMTAIAATRTAMIQQRWRVAIMSRTPRRSEVMSRGTSFECHAQNHQSQRRSLIKPLLPSER